MMLQDFRDNRDVIISSSVNSGQYLVMLWASGRITYSQLSGQPLEPGRFGIPVKVMQVASPHDFLKETVRPRVDATLRQ